MKKKVLLVVGMHRSGTSALTGLLNAFGADVPIAENTPLKADNPKGHWEHRQVNRINDDMLRQFGLTWASPGRVDPSVVAERQKTALLQFIQTSLKQSSSELVAYKDPRVCLLLPLWLDAICTAGAEPLVIFSSRDPGAVAASLLKRNRLGFERGLFLWLYYNLTALDAVRDVKSVSLTFPGWMSEPSALYRKIEEQLGIEWPGDAGAATGRADEFLEDSLVHHKANNPSQSILGKTSAELFELLSTSSGDLTRLQDDPSYLAFRERNLPWLESAAVLVQDERKLWREKINHLYSLINRNS